MNRTLGLDLGTNSLGWAILDDITGTILDKGVLIFPEGIYPAKDSLETPAAIRRAARMGRRMKFRRKMRKWNLLRLLIGQRMCPLRLEELDAWKKTGAYPVANTAFISWLHASDTSNPYIDRDRAAQGPVDPQTLGRALYHLAQRRGFRSSRKDSGDGEETSAAEKERSAVKGGIKALTEEIAQAGCKTLGQYFRLCLDRDRGKPARTRVRRRYTGRLEHYEREFDVIMEMQGYAPDDFFRRDAHDAIFMQRPLRSQKHLVGNCPLEPHSPRAQIGHPLFEEFRMLAFVNNLSFEDADGNHRDANGNFLHPLSAADRTRVCSAFMKVTPTFKFGDIRKLFKKDFAANGLDFHHYRDDETLSSCSTRSRLQKAFGEIPYDEQMVFDALTFFDDDAKLAAWFTKHFPALDEKQVSNLVRFHPREGNARYSLKAIRRMLPFLRKGFDLTQARFFAKLPDVIPDFSAHAETILDDLKALLFEYRREKSEFTLERARRGEKTLPLFDRYRQYLRDSWNIDDDAWNRLYLRGDAPYVAERSYTHKGQVVALAQPRLPRVELGMIRNPLVQRSMTTLRRLVNYLGEHGKLDSSDTIRIELARAVNDYATRQALRKWQQKREAQRAAARAELGANATEDTIDRWILWSEQNYVCLYTGKTISLDDLRGGTNFDIEHTIPRSLSGDDSLANRTLCDATYNREVKKGRIPRDCPDFAKIESLLQPWQEKVERLEKVFRAQLRAAKAATDPAARSARRIKALETKLDLAYWRDKLYRFTVTAEKLQAADGGLSGFKHRQLVDVGIMSSHAVDLLRSVYPRTFAVNGAATAFARRAWGIQGDEAKDRTNHTHHAKDAMVIAALTPARFTSICTALKDDTTADFRRPCDVCPPPYPDFAEHVRSATEEILVKHVLRQTTLRPSSKRTVLARAHHVQGDRNKPLVRAVLSQGDTVRGPLHKDTFYGCIVHPATEKKVFVERKPLVGPLKDAEQIAEKIIDPVIRKIVTERIGELKSAGAKNISEDDIAMPSGVPIRKVRIQAATTNPVLLRDHQYRSEKTYKTPYYVRVAERSNFRLALFRRDGAFSVQPDNSLNWAQNHKKADYTPLDRQPGFIGYVTPGSMALVHSPGHPDELRDLSQKELCKRLYKVVKFESDGRITLRRHSEARASVVLEKDLDATPKRNKKGESRIDLDNPAELLHISTKIYASQVVFEGVHFSLLLDGSIRTIGSKR